MGVVGKVKVNGPNGVFTVDVVDLGDSTTGHSLRIRTPKGIKEFNLVTPDDNRASALRVNTPWGVLAIAKDGRNEIHHPGSFKTTYPTSDSHEVVSVLEGGSIDNGTLNDKVFNTARGGLQTVELGTTELDNVVRVRWVARTRMVFPTWNPGPIGTTAHLQLGFYVSYNTNGGEFTPWELVWQRHRSRRYPGFTQTQGVTYTEDVAVTLNMPPGRHTIRYRAFEWAGDRVYNTPLDGTYIELLDGWTEYTK